MMDLGLERRITRALSESDYFRRPESRAGGRPGHKEWLHFAVHAGNLDLLTNFSIVDDVRPAAARGAELARITTLVRNQNDHGEWDGDIDQYHRDEVEVRGGAIDVEFGSNFVRWSRGVLEVKSSMRNRAIDVELVLKPLVLANQANTLYVDGCPAIHWACVPRLAASGRVVLGDRVYTFQDALAYHDHNWGSWRWGQNFAWEWGYGVPDDAAQPWTLIYVRLTDRKHVTTLTQSVFLWRHARQHRFFRPDEIEVEHEGLLRADRPFKLPRVMSLVSPARVTDIPERLIVSARGERDWLDFTFHAEDVGQVIIPNDDDLDVTIINEVSGKIEATGRVDGEVVRISGRTIFEFLSD